LNLDHHSDEALMAIMRDAHPRETWTVQAAFGELVLRHQDRIRAILLRKLPLDEADDLTQDVFMALFDTVVDGRDVGRVAPWLNKVAVHKRADFWRGKSGTHLKEMREGVALDADDPAGPGAAVRDMGEHGLMEAELLIDQLLARRSPQHQAIVRLNVLEGRSAKEVADATGATEANVYKVAQRFRDDLRAALSGDDPTSTDDRT
jgi:RNA polymerase sigma-70 factor (ECF subfamily)